MRLLNCVKLERARRRQRHQPMTHPSIRNGNLVLVFRSCGNKRKSTLNFIRFLISCRFHIIRQSVLIWHYFYASKNPPICKLMGLANGCATSKRTSQWCLEKWNVWMRIRVRILLLLMKWMCASVCRNGCRFELVVNVCCWRQLFIYLIFECKRNEKAETRYRKCKRKYNRAKPNSENIGNVYLK